MFGTRAELTVDLFLLALVICLVMMLAGVALARRGNVRAHAAVMIATFAVFLVALVVFEVSVRMGRPVRLPTLPLVVHLCFAIPCLVLWVAQVRTARTALVAPSPHRRRGRRVLVLLSFTVATGFWLYVATFA
jgi:uncharacterized membrane protein YozB (DUF420 family)